MPAALRLVLLCAAFALLACAVTHPLVFSMDHLLGRITPPGADVDVGDGMAFLGYANRAARALDAGESVWAVSIANPNFTAPPAYLFPVGLLTLTLGNVVVAHNVLLLTYSFLAFLCMFGFVHRLTASTAAALYSATLFGGCNYVIHHMSGGHANQSQIYLFPLIFLCLERVLDRPVWQTALPLGAALALAAHSSSQYSVFLSLLVPLYLVARSPSALKQPRHLLALALAGLTALGGTAFYLSVKLGAGTIERGLWENQQYVVQQFSEWLDPDAYAHLGVVPLLLAAGALAGRPLRHLRAPTRALAALLLFCMVMALGPMSSLHPYRWFYEGVPVFQLMRTPVRFVAPAQLAATALAGIGLAQLLRAYRDRPRRRRWALAAIVIGTALSTPLLADRYFVRSPGAGNIWVVEVDSHPYFQQVTRQ